MVKKGEFIAYAASLDVDKKYPTQIQIIIELAKEIIALKKRVEILEKKMS